VKRSPLDISRTAMMMPPPDETGVIKTSEPLELFTAIDIEGYKIDPKSLAGKVVVLNFWFINCPPCRQEIPELNKIAATYASNPDIVFIAIATDEKDKLKEFLKENPFAYHIVSDGRELATKYGIKGYPTNVIIGKDGKVKLHSMGYGPYTLDGFTKAIDGAK
jgi:thiol-disulfide isomerase/thioredoxin